MIAGQQNPGNDGAKDATQASGRLNDTQKPDPAKPELAPFDAMALIVGCDKLLPMASPALNTRKHGNRMRERHGHHAESHYSKAGDCQIDVFPNRFRKPSDRASPVS